MPSAPDPSKPSTPPSKPNYVGRLDPEKLDRLRPLPKADLRRIAESVGRNLRRGLLSPNPDPP
ncbi:MAG: hypothetical protein IT177_07765 [Acidobacteria bacterium]|nr:hypothetical protein [Acidobacteriota bacterium]